MQTSRFLFSLIFLVSLVVAGDDESVALQSHEQWWQKNCGNETMLKTLDGWLGSTRADSRMKMRTYISSKGYKSFLDIPCGLCTEFYGFKEDGIAIDYCGVDITPRFVDAANQRGLHVVQGSIENVPLQDSCFDVAYARHILEHLSYYQKAINELIRVADKEVIIIFFIKPSTEDDQIRPSNDSGAVLYHNCYNKNKLEEYVWLNHKVESIVWEDINKAESALHVYLNSSF